jgi:general secretion pathway protein H
MMTSPKTSSPGFTLIELMVVMAILAMMAAIVIPRISSGSATLLQAQMRQAMAVLNYARRSAIVEGQTKTVVFSEGSEEKTENQFTATANFIQWVSRGASVQSAGTEGDSNNSKGTEKKEEKENPNGGDNSTTHKITFYPEGGSSGGDLIFSYQGLKAKITVNPLTGKVESKFLDENDN